MAEREAARLAMRDHFASMAMLALMTCRTWNDRDAPYIAAHAYEMADAMIKARNEGR